MRSILILIITIFFSHECIFSVTKKSKEIKKIISLLEIGQFREVDNLIKVIINNDDKKYVTALYYFYKGDYDNALEELRNFKSHNSDSLDLVLYLEKLRFYKNKFEEYKFKHFNVRISDDDSILKYYLEENLDKIFYSVGKIFNYFPEDKVLIEIYQNKEDFAFASTLGDEAVKRSGAIAICKFNRIMTTSPQSLPYGYRWIDTICHEYIHFVLNRITCGKCPLWLHEGIAKYYETSWRSNKPLYLTPGNETILSKSVKENRLIPFSRMHPSLVYLKDQDEVGLAFAELATAVEYINTEYPNKLQLLLYTMSKKTVEKSFKTVFNFDTNKFEQNWMNYIKKMDLKEHSGAITDKVYWEKKDEIDEFVGVNSRDHLRLGDKFRDKNNYESAIIQYEKALNIEPYNPVVLIRIAKLYFEKGKIEDSIEKLKLCIDKNPGFVSSYEILGEYYLKLGEFEKSVKVLNEAIEINPFNPYTHRNLSKAYQKLNNYELSQQELFISEKIF